MTGTTRQTQRVRAPTFRPAFHAHWERATVPELLLLALVLAAPLAIGGVHLVTRIALAGVSVIAFAWAAQRLYREHRRVRVGLVGWGLALALLMTLVQLLPLPAGVVEALSPSGFEARVEAAKILGEGAPSWMPLTLDAGRTAAALVSLVAATLAYLTATSLRSDAAAVHRLVIGVEVAALLVLVVGALQSVFGIDSIYGSYEASIDTAAVPFLTTFVNPNHAAALFLLGALLAFGTSLSAERDQRWHLAVGVALASGVIATMSRACSILLVVGLVALTVPPLLTRRHRPMRARLLRLLIGASLCLFVAVVLVGPERWLTELAQLGHTDFADQGVVRECWRAGLEASFVSPAAGVGNGAFAAVSSSLTHDWTVGRMTFVHQGALQVLVDLGWPVGVAVLLLVASGFVLVVVRARKDLPAWGGVVALGAVAIQNGVDFSLWIPGVGVPAAVMLGAMVQATWPEEARRESTWRFPGWRWPLPASAALAGMLVVAVPLAWREEPERWQATARAALAAKTPSALDRSTLALAHPHDFVALGLAAALADQSGRREEAERWAARALALAPTEPGTLATAVRLALVRGDAAAALVLVERLDAVSVEGRRRALALVLASKALPGADTLMEGYFGGDAARVIDAERLLVESGDVEGAQRLLAWALDRYPDDVRVYQAFGDRMAGDLQRIDRLATECLAKAGLAADAPTRAAWERLGYYLQGRVEAGRGELARAVRLFRTAADLSVDARGADRVRPLLEAGKAAERMGDAAGLGEVVEQLDAIGPSGHWPEGEYHYLRSRRAELAGDLTLAIREMHEVLRHLGHVASFHDRLADLFYRNADDAAGDRARARARALDAAAKVP